MLMIFIRAAITMISSSACWGVSVPSAAPDAPSSAKATPRVHRRPAIGSLSSFFCRSVSLTIMRRLQSLFIGTGMIGVRAMAR
ncbi:hypothetical protein VH570_10270 [Sphingobium sp. HT1-2]|uniref:hypothetical protein n=1 Tax=Sphingobium sp. HT1-2 TaxID=3111640 RepID=UPI003BFB8A94